GASINVTPTAGGTYVYTVNGDDGDCVNTNTVTITVVAPLVSAIASDDTICAGSSTTLTANAISTGTVTVGSGSTTTSSYDGMFYSLWSNLHEQILVTAADL